MTSTPGTPLALDYEVRGAGDPILFISGVADDRNGWGLQVPSFENDYACIVFDNRDVGASPRVSEQYTVAEMADDAIGVLDRAGIERAHIVGHSLGGAISLSLAKRAPERVRSLTLIDTFAHSSTEYQKAIVGAWKTAARGLTAEQFTRVALPYWIGASTLEAVGADALVAEIAPAIAAQGVEAFCRQVTVVKLTDTRPYLAGISAPTLVVWSTEDTCTPESLSLELVDGIPGAKYVRIEGSGHSPTVEQPEALNSAIRDFLATVR